MESDPRWTGLFYSCLFAKFTPLTVSNIPELYILKWLKV